MARTGEIPVPTVKSGWKKRCINPISVDCSPLQQGGIFMKDWQIYVSVFGIFLLVLIAAIFIGKKTGKKKRTPVRMCARVAVFGSLSAILYVIPLFQIHFPFFPSFLAIHFDEIPTFIAGFAYGPWAAIGVIAIKTIIKLPFTSTLCVGELADLIFSLSYVLPAVLIYKKWRNLKGVALGFTVGTVCQLAVSLIMNIYAMLPFYMFVMGFPEEALLSLCQAANPKITSLGWPYGLYAVLPLNAMKDAIVMVVTFFVYRYIHVLLRFDRD